MTTKEKILAQALILFNENNVFLFFFLEKQPLKVSSKTAIKTRVYPFTKFMMLRCFALDSGGDGICVVIQNRQITYS